MRSKLSLGLIFACLVAIFAFLVNSISKAVVARGVNEIELRDAEADLKELYGLLGSATLRFRHHVFDWAVFDEAYNYIKYRDEKFITRNFSRLKIDNMHFTGAALYDIKGERLVFVDGSRLAYGEEWTDVEIQTFDRVVKKIKSDNLETSEGFVNIKGVAMLVVAHKIYDSKKDNPANGYLIMGSALDRNFRTRVKQIYRLDFSVLPLSLYNLVSGITIKDSIKFLKTPDIIHVYSVVNDIFGEPAFCLELQKQREIAAFGKEISHKNFLLMLFLCILVLAAGLIIIYCAQRRIIREEMSYRAKHDSLTDLPNSNFFLEILSKKMKEIKGDGICLGVIHINVDNFKSINDCFGYKQGDVVIREIANRLRELVPVGNVARSGADNFLVAMTVKEENLVLEQAKTIQAELQKPFTVSGSILHIKTSLGIAFRDDQAEDSMLLVHKAEHAMADAKNRGGNVIAFFEERMRTTAVEKMRLEIALLKAVEQNGLSVNYQPKIDISRNDVAGCEALVRWQISEGKWVPPPVFIPIAEKTGIITAIDMFVLRSACRQVLAWQKDGSGAVPIAVNMSVRSILSENFADLVRRILEEEGTPASLIEIEITESSFMTDMKKAFAVISRLNEAGIRIALDDFGTGYSSLKYLSAMPISSLKIDKSFVDDIFSGKETAQPLVKGIISLAASLGMHTVSEGVENKNQLAFLVGNGAHVIQGYLFSKPLSAEECGEFLRNRKSRIASVMR